MTKKKNLFAIATQVIVVLAVIVTISLCFVGCDGDPITNIPPVGFDHDDLGLEPEAAALEGIYSIDESQVLAQSTELVVDTDVKTTAAYLFNLANNNLCKVNWYANVATGNGTATINIGANASGNMEVREVRIKDGAAMYMETMGQVVDGTTEWIVDACRTLLNYGNRKYTPDGKTFYLQDGGRKALSDNSLANFYVEGTNYINWDECDDVRSISVDQFMKEEYYRSNYAETNSSHIAADTLEKASVYYDEEHGYYEIEMVVDVDSDALELAIASTRNSANSDDIVYAYQTIKCQVWDCGLFRYYSTDDSWEGSLLNILGGSSVNFWEKYFTYNKDNAPGLQIPTGMTWYNS